MKELFHELYNEWFANSEFWFSKNDKIDKYLSEKYFSKICLCDNTIDLVKNCNKSTIIGAIIAYDQIPRHYNRINPIDCNAYSKIAMDISLLIINDKVLVDEEFTSYNWCFIFLPFRHLKEVKYINSSIEFINFKYKCDKNKPSDRAIYKRFLKYAIRDVHKINTEKQLIAQKNESVFLNNSKWDAFQDILEHFPREDLSTNISNIDIKHIIKEQYDILNKININTHIIVSVSGGVDSLVCLHILKLILPENRITAVHINYNNRKECHKEVEFVKKYCSIINVKLYHRKIIEMKRNDYQFNGLRELYEDSTKDIRFETYRQVANINYDLDYIVVLGHNKDDCFENIITNISMKTNYDNLSGTSINTINNRISFLRPLLNIRKKDIVHYAKCMNIPYLQDSTPKWSMRGKIRDNILPSMEEINSDIIGSFFALKKRVEEWENTINEHILPKIINNFVQENGSIIGIFTQEDLIYNTNIWSKIFESNNFTQFFTRSVSHKCIREFSELIIRFKKDFKRMQDLNIFNNRIKFIIRKDIHSFIYRTKDNNICISFCKTQ